MNKLLLLSTLLLSFSLFSCDNDSNSDSSSGKILVKDANGVEIGYLVDHVESKGAGFNYPGAQYIEVITKKGYFVYLNTNTGEILKNSYNCEYQGSYDSTNDTCSQSAQTYYSDFNCLTEIIIPDGAFYTIALSGFLPNGLSLIKDVLYTPGDVYLYTSENNNFYYSYGSDCTSMFSIFSSAYLIYLKEISLSDAGLPQNSFAAPFTYVTE